MWVRTMLEARGSRLALVAILLLVFTLGGLRAARKASVTFDEFAHVPAGVAYWKEQAFLIYAQNPPLPRLIATWPILSRAKLPPIDRRRVTHPEYRWPFGEQFLRCNVSTPHPTAGREGPGRQSEGASASLESNAYDQLFYLARLPVLFLGLVLGLLIYRWSDRLFGFWGGLISLALYAFSPTVLAHTSLATVDLTLGFFGTLSVYTAWLYWKRPTLWQALLLGMSLGAVLATKFTAWLFVLPVAIAFFGAGHRIAGNAAGRGLTDPRQQRERKLSKRESSRKRPSKGGILGLFARWWLNTPRLWAFLLIVVTAWLIVCASYFFTDLFCPIGRIPLQSTTMRSMQDIFPKAMPCPLPTAYLLGMDREMARSEVHQVEFYLLGQRSHKGWPAYFPIAFATKTPLPVLLLVGTGAVALLFGLGRIHGASQGQDGGSASQHPGHGARRHPGSGNMAAATNRRWTAIFLLLPPALFFIFFVTMGTTNAGIRYLLVCLPFLFIAAGSLAVCTRRLWQRLAILLLLIWHVSGSIHIAPHYLSYFNEIAGGPPGGLRILADSNVDWGQGLKELKRYMTREGLSEIALSYCGPVDPRVYGIRWRPARLGQIHGPVAISANHLVGLFPLRGAYGAGVQDFGFLREREPEAVLANSIYLYHLD
ncbi:MAG: glycosyltransferase family 39 protein [Candidatus Eisenbacteria sp.]|nr:glycosyltransferase family 39 protein [Candidatus Eisenbacteria bacterium]